MMHAVVNELLDISFPTEACVEEETFFKSIPRLKTALSSSVPLILRSIAIGDRPIDDRRLGSGNSLTVASKRFQ